MGIRSIISKPIAAYVVAQQKKWVARSAAIQAEWRQSLVSQAVSTAFGKDHYFKDIRTYTDFKQAIPVRDYEDLTPYIDRILAGEENILWAGKPLYFVPEVVPDVLAK